MFSIKPPDFPHSIGFCEASAGEFAHKQALRASQEDALISLDVLINDDSAGKMKAEFIEAMKKAGRWKLQEKSD